MTKYYADVVGTYLGGFDGVTGPLNGVEIPIAPSSATDKWNGSAWLAQIAIPKVVTMRQARLSLYRAGYLPSVQAAIDAAGGTAKIEWDTAATVDRNAGLVPQMATALGLTATQLDALFVMAASL